MENWKEFANATSVNGAALILQEAKLKTRWRVFSTLFFVFLLLSFGLSLKALLVYLKFHTETKVTLVAENRIRFPAVTLCNSNIYRRSSVAEAPLLPQLMSMFYAGFFDEKTFFEKVCVSYFIFVFPGYKTDVSFQR